MRVVEPPAVPEYVRKLQAIESFAEISEVMRSTDFAQGATDDRRAFLFDTLIFIEGPEHDERKRVYGELFSRESIAYYERHLLQPVIDATLARLDGARGEDGLARADFAPMIRLLLHRIAAQVTGVDGVDTDERTERFRQLITAVNEATSSNFARGDSSAMVEAGFGALRMLIAEFLQASLDRRMELVRRFQAGDIGKEELPRDALTAKCLQGDLFRDGDKEEKAHVWRECTLFLIASTGTTSISLPHVVAHIDEWIREHPEDAGKTRDPEFLRLCVTESLRLHQTAPVKFRVALRDVTLSTGRTVAKGEMVALHAPAANLDPALFGADAKQFNPYRTPPEGIQSWGLTFGVGPHMCIGRSLVTGIKNRPDEKYGAEGMMVRILKSLYARGMALDPDRPPVKTRLTFHDAYESMPVVFAAR
jgi:cytochrome P450